MTLHWSHRAACRGHDTSLWFAEHTGEESIAAVALDVCAICPVRADCLEDAIRTGDQGIRGGTTTKQRAGINRPSTWDEDRIDLIAGLVRDDLADGALPKDIASDIGVRVDSLARAMTRGGHQDIAAALRVGWKRRKPAAARQGRAAA